MLFFLYVVFSYIMALNWCISQEVLPGCFFCLQFVDWTFCVYFMYSMASTFIEILSQTSFFVLFAVTECFLGRGKTFRWSSTFPFLLVYVRLKHFFLTKVQHECQFKIRGPLPAVDVFLRHLSNNSLIWQFNNSFLKKVLFSKCFPALFPVLHRDMVHARQLIRNGVVLHLC